MPWFGTRPRHSRDRAVWNRRNRSPEMVTVIIQLGLEAGDGKLQESRVLETTDVLLDMGVGPTLWRGE
jgi:hypothetical protein